MDASGQVRTRASVACVSSVRCGACDGLEMAAVRVHLATCAGLVATGALAVISVSVRVTAGASKAAARLHHAVVVAAGPLPGQCAIATVSPSLTRVLSYLTAVRGALAAVRSHLDVVEIRTADVRRLVSTVLRILAEVVRLRAEVDRLLGEFLRRFAKLPPCLAASFRQLDGVRRPSPLVFPTWTAASCQWDAVCGALAAIHRYLAQLRLERAAVAFPLAERERRLTAVGRVPPFVRRHRAVVRRSVVARRRTAAWPVPRRSGGVTRCSNTRTGPRSSSPTRC